MIQIESAGITDVGKQREGNEDAYLLDDEHQLYVVADGMGGHLAGEVASGIVVETFRSALERDDASGIAVIDETLSAEGNRVLAWIQTANELVHRKAQQDEDCRGMGSTVSAVYCTDSTMITANVGDSPIYLVRNGEIELISFEHTVAAEQAGTDPERLKRIPEKFLHMLSRAVGVAEDVEADASETPCFTGDIVIICSDGLSNLVSPEEICTLVAENPPDAACRLFVDMANDRGGHDNITVIVLKITGITSKKGLLAGFLPGLWERAGTLLKNLINR